MRVLYDYIATEKNALSLRAGELATLLEVLVIPPPFVYPIRLPPSCVPFASFNLFYSCVLIAPRFAHSRAVLLPQNFEHGWCTVRMILTGKEGYFPGQTAPPPSQKPLSARVCASNGRVQATLRARTPAPAHARAPRAHATAPA